MASPIRSHGFALVTALLFVAVLSVLTGMVALFTVNNARHTRSNVLISRTLAVAQGARNFGATLLQTSIRANLQREIDAEALAGRLGANGAWAFDKYNVSQIAPDPDTVITNLNTVASNLQARLTSGGCYGPFTLAGNETLQVRITFTANMPLCDGSSDTTNVKLGYGRFLKGARSSQQTYTLPYAMVVTGVNGEARRTLTLSGQYNFTVGNGSFSRYALFTDSEQVASNSNNFFTGSYLFDGPVHTNGNFAFYGNTYDPTQLGTGQPYFLGPVSSVGQNDRKERGAYFLGSDNNKLKFLKPAELSPPVFGGTKPQFQEGVDWSADYIALPSKSDVQKNEAIANGLYVGSNVKSLTLFAGDADGNVLTKVNDAWQPSAGSNADTYQYIEICVPQSSCDLYRQDANKVLWSQTPSGTWQQKTAAFNGVIYVDGNVESFSGPDRPSSATNADTTPPAVASFAQLNVVTSKDLRVTGDVTYQDAPCDGVLHRGADGTPLRPNCTDDPGTVRNVLGIYAAGDGGGSNPMCSFPNGKGSTSVGNICFGFDTANPALNAPENLHVDASLLATNKVDMENYNTGATRGTLSILGGVITRYDGVFGVFSSSSGYQVNGVLPRFTYDPRFDNGLAPPFFPTVELASMVGSAEPIIYSQTEQSVY